MSSGIQKQLDEGAVPNHVSNVCPKGTKMWVSIEKVSFHLKISSQVQLVLKI